MNDLFWMTLTFVKGLGNTGIKKLYIQSPTADFPSLLHSSFIQVVSKSVQEQLTNPSYMQELKEKAISHIEVHNQAEISVIPITSEYYPTLLRLINDPPAILYAKGNLDLLKKTKNVAIVGTRNPTKIGLASAKKIASTFAQRGYTIVSGLATGIDTAGHEGALQVENGKTIAVLAGNLKDLYPLENRDLSNDILKNDGLLLSETPIDKGNIKGNFVKRDRIQSGLSLGICPVQTPLTGGTQHTIQFAREYDRFLFTPIPLEDDEDAVQGNLELISSGVPVLKNTDGYDQFEQEMEKTYQYLMKKIESETSSNELNIKDLENYEQGSLY